MADKYQVENLNLYYGNFHALKDINLNIKEKEMTAFIGPSGCGKSTFISYGASFYYSYRKCFFRK